MEDVCSDQDQEDYSFKLNKNLKRLARKSALSIQANDKNLVVVEDFNFETPKTKNFIDVLKALELDTKKSLFVLGSEIQMCIYHLVT